MEMQEIVEKPQPESQPAGVAHIWVQKPRPIGKAFWARLIRVWAEIMEYDMNGNLPRGVQVTLTLRTIF